MERPLVKNKSIKSLALAIHSIITREFEKIIKIPRLTDTDYVIFLIRSAKANIQLSYKVRSTRKWLTKRFLEKPRAGLVQFETKQSRLSGLFRF